MSRSHHGVTLSAYIVITSFLYNRPYNLQEAKKVEW
jgi:hypothetical protein